MMTKEVLGRYLRKELTLDDVRFQGIIKSHIEANAEIEVYKKESVLKNGLINQYKAEIAECQRKVNDVSVELMLALDERNKLKAEVEMLTKIRGSAWLLSNLLQGKVAEYGITGILYKALVLLDEDLANIKNAEFDGKKEE